MNTYYHVTTDLYQAGEDLLSFSNLDRAGYLAWDDENEITVWAANGEPVWKWDAEYRTDDAVVCLYEDREQAEEHVAEFGGQLLTITLPDPSNQDACDEAGIEYTRVAEGYLAVVGRIPAEHIR
jgi:hypothetical protein